MRSCIKILHVDDEPDFAEMAATFLGREDGVEVVTETEPRDALERLREEDDIDCVVSDYEMPEMDGLELLDAVRDERPDLPFLLFTGRGSEEVASEAISRGATDYLQKGTGTEQYELLANRVRNAVEQYTSERRVEEHRRINEVVSEVNKAIVRASSGGEVERRICEILADTPPYTAACVARADEEDRLRKEAYAGGSAEDYFKETRMSVADGSPGGDAPEGHAFHEREITVCQDVRDDPAYEEWRDAAQERDFRSLAAVPLEYGDELYGLLVVFADCPDAFDETEKELLEEIGDDVAYSLYTEEISLRERAMDEAPVGVTIAEPGDDDNPLVYANDGFVELTGYPRDEVLGHDCRFLQGERTEEEPVAEMRRALDAEEPVTVELRNYKKSGEEYWNRITIAPLRGEGGDVTNYVGFQEDVTERKEHERSLMRYRRMVDAMKEATCVYDAEGRFVVVNDYLANFYGTTTEELVGEPSNLVPALPDGAYEELVEGEREEIRGEVERDFPGHGHAVLEYRLTRLTHDDEFEGVVGVAREITERKERECELRKNERRFEAVFEDPGMLVGILDTDGTLREANETSMEYVDVNRSDVLGEPFWGTPWWTDDIRDEVRRQVERAAGGEYAEYEADLLRPDGAPYSVEGTVRPVTDADGDVVSLVVSARDVTERRKRERTIQRRNEMLEELAGYLSHDLRTPLSTVRGRLELALETGETEHVEKASVALDRVDEMLADTVNVLRTGDIVGDTDEVDIEEVVDDVVTVELPEAASVEVPEPPRVEADEDAIRRLLGNLVSNSVEHGDGDGEAHIRIGRLDGGFYYEDDGPGIVEENREEVFEPGFSTKEEKGTGMGLASVRQIVLAHGWEISVKDAETLGGVRFEIRTAE